jgi:hypothetical protein
MKSPWSRQELDRLLPRLEAAIAATEADRPEARPLPPMTVAECLDYGMRLMDLAGERPLSTDECFLHGQLLAVLIQAAKAEALGYKGRHFVISEGDVAGLV